MYYTQITSCTQWRLATCQTTRTCTNTIRITRSWTYTQENMYTHSRWRYWNLHVSLQMTGCLTRLMNMIRVTCSLYVCTCINTPERGSVCVCMFIKQLYMCAVPQLSFSRNTSQGSTLDTAQVTPITKRQVVFYTELNLHVSALKLYAWHLIRLRILPSTEL